MISAMLQNINVKRLAISIAVLFVYLFVSGFIIHEILLKDIYLETATLWRTPEEMQQNFLWMLLGHLLIAKFFVLIFAKGYEGKGLMEGVRYGLFIGGFAIAPYFIQYAVTPIPCKLLGAWVVTGFIQMVIGGVVAAAVYKK